MEYLIYGGALGVVAALIVPLLYGFTSKFLPATVTANANVPSVLPTGGAAIIWSVAAWGVFFGVSLWLISMIRPVGSAVRETV